jgi:hypothetical protein
MKSWRQTKGRPTRHGEKKKIGAQIHAAPLFGMAPYLPGKILGANHPLSALMKTLPKKST